MYFDADRTIDLQLKPDKYHNYHIRLLKKKCKK